MKAALCREHGAPLSLEDITIVEPVGRQIKVKIGACAICHSDIHYMQGAWQGELPAVFGHEAAGVVSAVGPEATAFSPGDRVIVTLIRSCGSCFYCDQGEPGLCDDAKARDGRDMLQTAAGEPVTQGMKTGAFAEYVVVEQTQAARIPDDMPLDVASLLACGVITGVGAAVNTARVRPGDSVVVVGVGGVGLNSIQGAAISGASTIIALDVEANKLEAAKQFGATHGILVGDEKVSKQIRALTSGRGADHALVTVGSKAAIDSSYRFICRGGQVVIVGMPATGVQSEFCPLTLAGAMQTIKGSYMGQTRLTVDIPWLLKLYAEGRLKLDELISHRFPLAEINEAVADTLAGQSLRNVLIVDPAIV